MTDKTMKKVLSEAMNEVRANFKYFQSKFPELKKTHPNEFALLHKKKIIEFFESENDAIKIGMKDYGEGHFSVQQVADTFIDLGYQSHVPSFSAI